ncbi:hypothetical protein HOA59_02905 [archaeon]|nr:hypothetical protein [archaeon]MBT6824360.1 hypothetical protein [archaeon]MBT7106910.1 hypothetical protein [archaeon]MBT7297463.1 hypothetical protein [archaeon]
MIKKFYEGNFEGEYSLPTFSTRLNLTKNIEQNGFSIKKKSDTESLITKSWNYLLESNENVLISYFCTRTHKQFNTDGTLNKVRNFFTGPYSVNFDNVEIFLSGEKENIKQVEGILEKRIDSLF